MFNALNACGVELWLHTQGFAKTSSAGSSLPRCVLGLQASGKLKVQHIPYDFKWHAKQPGADILQDMAPVLRTALDKTGIFVCPPAPPSVVASRACLSNSWVGHVFQHSGFLVSFCYHETCDSDYSNFRALLFLASLLPSQLTGG